MTPKTELSPRSEGIASPASGHRMITSADLFAGADEIVVLHNGAHYRLRVTRQDKLILTK